jgi:hypothetical protein
MIIEQDMIEEQVMIDENSASTSTTDNIEAILNETGKLLMKNGDKLFQAKSKLLNEFFLL